MKKMTYLYLAFIFSFLCLAPDILAGDSVSIEVSCIVPAIPGLNAPLLETVSSRQPALTVSEPINQQPLLPIVEEEDQKNGINSDGEEQTLLVRTFYAR